MIKKILLALSAATIIAGSAHGADLSNWSAIEKAAKGQTVYFNAWGGAQNINDYIAWAGEDRKSVV